MSPLKVLSLLEWLAERAPVVVRAVKRIAGGKPAERDPKKRKAELERVKAKADARDRGGQ